MRVTRSLKFLLLSLAVFSVVIPFLPYFVVPVHAEEPTLVTILSNLGFENITLTDVETFSAGTYNITLYAEFAGWHNINELSYYELNASDVFNVIFYGSDGGSGYVVPPVNKSFTADYEFGLSMLSQYNRRYFTQNYRNGDGKTHSVVYENLDDTGMYLLGFENTWGGGDQDYNDMVFSLKPYTPPVNTPPSISGLPNLGLDEDTSLDNAIDLWNYASDAETPDENLIFTVLSVTEPDVGVTLDSNRYIDLQPTANWYGTSDVTIQVSDGELTDTDSFTITVNSVNDPPVASNLAISPSSPVTTDDLVGSYDYYDLEGDPESGTEIRWYKDSVLQSAYNDALTIPSSATAKGEAWYFTVKPKDGMDFGDLQTSPTVVIGNSPPTAPVVDVTPDSPVTADDLVCTVTSLSVDPDGDTITYTYEWYKDEVLQPAETTVTIALTDTVSSTLTAKGQVWKCVVTPNDGMVDGTSDEDQVTIGNTPPEASNLAISPPSPYTTDDLVGSYTYYDADGDPESGSEIRWYKDGSLQSAFNDLLTVPSSATAKGQVWYFTVKPKDGTSFGALQTSPSVTIQNSPPTAPVVDVTPDFPLTTDDLTCTVVVPSTDPDGDTVTYTYEWYKNDVLQPSLTTTTTALSVTIDSSNTNKGEVWKCVVTPHGSDGPPDEDEVTIQNSPPFISGVNITPDPAYTDDALTATPYGWSDADGDAAQYVYQWQKWNGANWQNISGETSNTLSSNNFVKGDQIKVICTPFDGEDYGVPKEDTITISNSPPSTPVVDVTPDSPVTTDDLTCTVTSPSTDPDGDTVTYTYKWYKDGNLQSGLTTITTALSVTIDSSNTAEGEVWKCVVTPNDGTEDGPTDQDEVTIGTIPNSPPVLDPISNKIIDEENPLSFTATASDPEVPPQTLTFSLELGAPSGASITSGGYFTWTPTEAQGAGVYYINITVSDGIDIDYEVITVTVNEVNVAPVLDPIGNKNVDELDTLSFTATASDADIPAQTLTFSLGSGAPSGASITSGGAFTWTPTEAQGPGSYVIRIIVSDSITQDYEDIMVTVNEVNTPPVLDSIGPKSVNEGSTLSFTATASDVDIPAQTLSFSLGAGAPSGTSITSGGAFIWTPTEAQGPAVYSINVTVSDGIAIDYEVIEVTVNEVNQPPVLSSIGPKTVSEETLLQFTVTASDSDIPTQTLTYSASNLPPGATFDPGTRVFSWTPVSGQAGVYYNVHFEVSDGYLKDSEDITITVTSGAPPPQPVGGSALPITLDLGTSNPLIPRIGLASALSAIVVAITILVRRRKKTSKREH